MATFKLHLLALKLALIWRLNVGVLGFYIVDYAENTELIEQRAGRDLSLECNLKELVDARPHDARTQKVHWYFKQCKGTNCYSSEGNHWRRLPCVDGVNSVHACGRKDLQLRNLSHEDSGLYRCTFHGEFAGEPLARTYHLDVQNTTSLNGPEFIDGAPANMSASVGAQVIFNCQIYSQEHPTIRWFQRLLNNSQRGSSSSSSSGSNNNVNNSAILYNGRAYLPLSTPLEQLIAPQTYFSKLMLKDLRARDEGYYACAAITYRGHKIREAYLSIEEPEYWQDYVDTDEMPPPSTTDLSKFWSLFLMPFGLAILPLLFWLLYRALRTANNFEETTNTNIVSSRIYFEVPLRNEDTNLYKI